MNNLEQLEATFDAKISPGVLKEAMKEAGASSGGNRCTRSGRLTIGLGSRGTQAN